MRNPMGTILVQGGPRTMPERPRAVIATSASGNDVEVFGVRINLNIWSFSTEKYFFSAPNLYRNDGEVIWKLISVFLFFFFKQSGILWRMKMNGEVLAGSHRYISSQYRGVPSMIDAAVRWDSRTVYFFKGNRCVLYNWTIIQKSFNNLA